jgi:hypothetical protein
VLFHLHPNKLKPYRFVENHTPQPIITKPSDLLLDELVGTNHYSNVFIKELIETHHSNDLFINEYGHQKLG